MSHHNNAQDASGETNGGQTSQEPVPDARSLERIQRATAMIVGGMLHKEAAQNLEITSRVLSGLRAKYRQLWDDELERAGAKLTRRYAWVNARARPAIAKATALMVGGMTRAEVVREMGLKRGTIKHWQNLHKQTWKDEYQRAVDMLGALSQRDDPSRLRQLSRARRWEQRQKQLRLFDDQPVDELGLSGAMTVTDFYCCYVSPKVLKPGGAADRTLEEYSTSLHYWRLATGDPPLTKIDAVHCEAFLNFLKQLPGRDRAKIGSESIRKHCVQVQRVLNLAGPPVGHRTENRDLYGWIEHRAPNGQPIFERKRIPYVKRPPKEHRPVKNVFKQNQYEAFLGVCHLADWPKIPGIAPPDFWESLTLWIDNVGTRIKTTVHLERSMIDGHVLTVPAAILKGRYDQELWVNNLALQAAEKIRTADRLLFAYRQSLHSLHKYRRHLMGLAGIKQPGLGFHGLRKRLAGRLAARSPVAAQKQLGHRQGRTTTDYYIPLDAVQDAFEEMPDETNNRRET